MGPFAWRPSFPEALRREETVSPTRPIGSGLPGRVASSLRISNALNHDCIELGALLLIGDGIVGLIIFIGRFVESKARGRTLSFETPHPSCFALALRRTEDRLRGAGRPPTLSAKEGAGLYYVYLVESVSAEGQRYVGMTDDLGQRLREHNEGESSHTSKSKPRKLATYIAFTDRAKAEAFERYL